MKTNVFNPRWVASYAIVCATLLIGGGVSGQIASWSAEIVGGTDCNTQADLLEMQCEQDTSVPYDCAETVRRCNQNPGNATKICQVKAGGDACRSPRCKNDFHDDATTKDAQGNPCTPVQI